MWLLIVYIGAGLTLQQTPQGGPTTATFETLAACQAGLKQIQQSFGEERSFDQRFQYQPGEGESPGRNRLWTVKGVCVSQK